MASEQFNSRIAKEDYGSRETDNRLQENGKYIEFKITLVSNSKCRTCFLSYFHFKSTFCILELKSRRGNLAISEESNSKVHVSATH